MARGGPYDSSARPFEKYGVALEEDGVVILFLFASVILMKGGYWLTVVGVEAVVG